MSERARAGGTDAERGGRIVRASGIDAPPLALGAVDVIDVLRAPAIDRFEFALRVEHRDGWISGRRTGR